MECEIKHHDSDQFADSDKWLAAQIRQLFRANGAGDIKAAEVGLRYFDDYVFKTLQRHLSDCSSWANKGRWFDGMMAKAEYRGECIFGLRGKVAWVDDNYYYDPFDFEFELCSRTGNMIRYVLRFGDFLPLAQKFRECSSTGIPVGGWVYEIRRTCGDAAPAESNN